MFGNILYTKWTEYIKPFCIIFFCVECMYNLFLKITELFCTLLNNSTHESESGDVITLTCCYKAIFGWLQIQEIKLDKTKKESYNELIKFSFWNNVHPTSALIVGLSGYNKNEFVLILLYITNSNMNSNCSTYTALGKWTSTLAKLNICFRTFKIDGTKQLDTNKHYLSFTRILTRLLTAPLSRTELSSM